MQDPDTFYKSMSGLETLLTQNVFAHGTKKTYKLKAVDIAMKMTLQYQQTVRFIGNSDGSVKKVRTYTDLMKVR